MKNAIQDGKYVNYAHSAIVTSGQVLVVNNLCMIATKDGAADELIAYLVKDCVVELVKKTVDTFAVGNKLYWDATPGELTTTAEDNNFIGTCVEAKSGSGNGKVHLNLYIPDVVNEA